MFRVLKVEKHYVLLHWIVSFNSDKQRRWWQSEIHTENQIELCRHNDKYLHLCSAVWLCWPLADPVFIQRHRILFDIKAWIWCIYCQNWNYVPSTLLFIASHTWLDLHRIEHCLHTLFVNLCLFVAFIFQYSNISKSILVLVVGVLLFLFPLVLL